MVQKIFISGVYSTEKATLTDRFNLKDDIRFENRKLIHCPELARQIMTEKGIGAESTIFYGYTEYRCILIFVRAVPTILTKNKRQMSIPKQYVLAKAFNS